jgi:hypothetical protein
MTMSEADYEQEMREDISMRLGRSDTAPYPRNWTVQERVSAYWYALSKRISCPERPDDPDEGAWQWLDVAAMMQRDEERRRAKVEALRNGTNPNELPLAETPRSTDEPQTPNPIGDW